MNKIKERKEKKDLKREEKRKQIAESTIRALCQLGYCNTSLRDIAELSGNALGTLHYYFEDRDDLIIYSLKHYKDRFLAQYTDVLKNAETLDDTISELSQSLAEALVYRADTHRLWYDIRNQAIFEPAFQDIVGEFEDGLIHMLSIVEQRFLAPRANSQMDYIAIDGLFRYLMQNDHPEHRDLEYVDNQYQQLLKRIWAP